MKHALPILALLLAGCATHQVRFEPWAGVPAAEQAALQRGEFAVSKDQLFDAAATTLEHEPYLHWEISTLDKANGLLKASAGFLREVQLRVAQSESGTAKLGISVPRRELKTRAKIYLKKGDHDQRTAYEPAEKDLGGYTVVSADVELNEDYFRSFTWRVLHDRTQVPFKLQGYEGALPVTDEVESELIPPKPTATPVPAPLKVDEGPRLPVRVDAGATP